MSIFLKGSEEMKVKFTLSNGQSFATKITYGFKDTRDLVENLSRMLGEATDKSVVELETEDGMFLVRPTDIVSVEIRS